MAVGPYAGGALCSALVQAIEHATGNLARKYLKKVLRRGISCIITMCEKPGLAVRCDGFTYPAGDSSPMFAPRILNEVIMRVQWCFLVDRTITTGAIVQSVQCGRAGVAGTPWTIRDPTIERCGKVYSMT